MIVASDSQNDTEKQRSKSSKHQSQAGAQSKVVSNLLPQLTDETITKYLKNFVTINDYRTIDQGRQLINLLSKQQNQCKIETTIKMVCYFFQHTKAQGKVCGLQFIKQLIDLGKVKIFTVIQKLMISHMLDAIQYRNNIKTILRGSTYFMKEIDKNQKDGKVSQLVRLANTYVRMNHQMLYIWGTKYFPSSQFGILYNKLSKYCTFPQYPKDFKFYRQLKVQQNSKNEKFVSINKYAKQRKIKAFDPGSNSGRKRKSKNIEKKNQLIDQNQQKTKNQQKLNNNSTKEKQKQISIQQQDIFEAQQSIVSKIYQKGSKIASKPPKNPKKIPGSIIYRQSSIQDPVDVTAQIALVQKRQPIKEKKVPNIQTPMGMIPEVNSQDGSSKIQTKGNSVRSPSQQPFQKQVQAQKSVNLTKQNNESRIKIQQQKIQQQQSYISTQKNAYLIDSNSQYSGQYEEQKPKVSQQQLGLVSKASLNINIRQGAPELKSNPKKQAQQVEKLSNRKSQIEKQVKSAKEKLRSQQESSSIKNEKKIGYTSKQNHSDKNMTKQDENIQKVELINSKKKTNKQQIEDRQFKNIKSNVEIKQIKDKGFELHSEKGLAETKQKEKNKVLKQGVAKKLDEKEENQKKNQKYANNSNHEQKVNILSKQSAMSMRMEQKPTNNEKTVVSQYRQISNQLKNKKQIVNAGIEKRQTSDIKSIDNEIDKKLNVQTDNISSNQQKSQNSFYSGVSIKNSKKKKFDTPKSSKKSIKWYENMQNKNSGISDNIQLNDSEPIQIQSKGRQKRSLFSKRLSFNHIYDIKQLCKGQKIKQELQFQIQNQIEKQSIRRNAISKKLRKFRYVALALIPDQEKIIEKTQSQILQKQQSELKNFKQKISSQIKISQNKILQQHAEHVKQIRKIIEQHQQRILNSTNNVIQQSIKKQKTFFSKTDSLMTSINNTRSQSKEKNRQRSYSKRSSLSEIKNQGKFTYEEGTMLFYLNKRKSVIL